MIHKININNKKKFFLNSKKDNIAITYYNLLLDVLYITRDIIIIDITVQWSTAATNVC